MKKSFILSIDSYLAQHGWSMVESKKALTRWQKIDNVCLLQLALAVSRRTSRTFQLHFAAHVILDIWKDALTLDDGMNLPTFNAYSGIATKFGFSEENTNDGILELKDEDDILSRVVKNYGRTVNRADFAVALVGKPLIPL